MPLPVAPLLAHKVELDGTIGATLHIEPNDTPRAGEPALTWFALTKRGGASVTLTDCDCQLAVFSQSESEPVLEPELKAVNAEGYEDIPGADINFPSVGAYELVLTGAPVSGDGFEAFELRFSVTVAAGQAAVPEMEGAQEAQGDGGAEGEPTGATREAEIRATETAQLGVEEDKSSGESKVRSRTSFTIGIGVLAAAAGVGLAFRRRK
ncbi:MAG: hypothetical protein AAF921_08250 [Cyanobacteria bacterium P01_D01_bin.44]